MNWKKIISWSTIAIATPIITYWSYYNIQLHTTGCRQEITPKYSKQQIEDIIKEVKTPKEAFYKISKDLVITGEADTTLRCESGERAMSMIENYSLGVGDCVEGAINFKAMLSDNPEYKIKLISIRQKDESIWNKNKNKGKNIKHLLATYEFNKKIGVVSFNNSYNNKEWLKNNKEKFFLLQGAEIYFDNRYPKDIFNFLTPAKFDSLDEAIIAFNNDTNLGGSIEYDELFISLECLKFGKRL